MPRPKSILRRVEVDEVKRAHNCQHNVKHRLQSGEKRLKIWSDRSPDNYCVACALNIISRDIERLQELMRQLSS